jgi:hypothetical protein
MAHEKIVDRIIDQLRFQDAHAGYFHQEPYKGAFFRLFVAAAEEGDGPKAYRLRSFVASRAPGIVRRNKLALLYAAWSEWDYVWAHAKRGAPLDDVAPGG